MKKLMRRSIALLMMLVMIMAAASVAVSAKTVSKTVKKQKFTTSTKAIEKKAVKVKKAQQNLMSRKVRATSGSLHLRPRHIHLPSQNAPAACAAATDMLRL